MSRYKAHIDHANCRRCGNAFNYYRVRKPKYYCCPCRAAERRDSIKFYNSKEYRDARKERNKVAQIVVAF